MAGMAQRSSNTGCFIVVAVLGVIALAVVAFYGVFAVRRAESMDRHAVEVAHTTAMDAEMGGGERLVFTEPDRPRLSVPAAGEPVTLEMFAGYMIDDAATDLAKDGFRRAADQAQVSWRMRLKQVSERNGELRGQFDVPWQIRHGHGSSSSSFGVEVIFDEAERDALLELRRGQWEEVEGQLDLSSGHPRIMNAVVAGNP